MLPPFGQFVRDAVGGALDGFINTSNNATSKENMDGIANDWEDEFLYNKVSVDDLKTKYTFTYYPTIEDAMNKTNPTTELNASIGTYYDNGVFHIVLLRDMTISSIEINEKTVLNLGGKTLQFSSTPGITVNDDLTIEGALEGSEMKSTQYSTQARLAHVSEKGKLILNKGTYTSTTTGIGESYAFYVDGDMVLNGANVNANETTGKTYCIVTTSKSYVEAKDSKLFAVSTSGRAYGVSGSGKLDATNTEFVAYSSFGETAYGNGYTSMSSGISSGGEITLKDCYAYGTHSGMSISGTANIDGGEYIGYNCGGIYISGANQTSYIKNASFKEGAMPDGYTDESGGNNKAAMYIGGSAGKDNITVYIDNCVFEGERQPIVLRGTSSEKTIHFI